MKKERNIQYTTIEELTDRLDKYMKKKKWMENAEQETVNGHRTEILKSCISLSQGEKGIYQLTVPTEAVRPFPLWHLRCIMQHSIKWSV